MRLQESLQTGADWFSLLRLLPGGLKPDKRNASCGSMLLDSIRCLAVLLKFVLIGSISLEYQAEKGSFKCGVVGLLPSRKEWHQL